MKVCGVEIIFLNVIIALGIVSTVFLLNNWFWNFTNKSSRFFNEMLSLK